MGCVYITVSTGATGVTGATGTTGAVGATGATGATGTNVTATAGFAANTTGAPIIVTVLGTAVPLPSSQVLPADITVDGTNTVFTCATAGRYRLSYAVNTTAGIAMGTRLLINGAANIASTISAVATLSSFSNEILLDLAANTTVSLQLFGISATATLLNNSAGATLMIVRLS